MRAGLVALGGSRREFVSCFFQLLEAACIPWAVAPALQSLLLLYIIFPITLSDLLASFLWRPLWLHLVPSGQPGRTSSSQDLSFNHTCNVLLPYKVTLLGFRDWGVDIFVGTIIQLTMICYLVPKDSSIFHMQKTFTSLQNPPKSQPIIPSNQSPKYHLNITSSKVPNLII